MNLGEDDTLITTFVENRPCLCGHSYRQHVLVECSVCECDRFCSSLPPVFEREQLEDLT